MGNKSLNKHSCLGKYIKYEGGNGLLYLVLCLVDLNCNSKISGIMSSDSSILNTNSSMLAKLFSASELLFNPSFLLLAPFRPNTIYCKGSA